MTWQKRTKPITNNLPKKLIDMNYRQHGKSAKPLITRLYKTLECIGCKDLPANRYDLDTSVICQYSHADLVACGKWGELSDSILFCLLDDNGYKMRGDCGRYSRWVNV